MWLADTPGEQSRALPCPLSLRTIGAQVSALEGFLVSACHIPLCVLRFSVCSDDFFCCE